MLRCRNPTRKSLKATYGGYVRLHKTTPRRPKATPALLHFHCHHYSYIIKVVVVTETILLAARAGDVSACYEHYHCQQLSPMAFAWWASSTAAAWREYHCSASNLSHFYHPTIFKPSQRLSLRQLSPACCMSEVPRAQTGRDHRGICQGALHCLEKYYCWVAQDVDPSCDCLREFMVW